MMKLLASALLVDKRGLRYLLFDLTILLSFVAGAWILLGDGSNYCLISGRDCPNADTGVDVADDAPAANVCGHSASFEVGDPVEVYDPRILAATAFPAIVVSAGVASDGDGEGSCDDGDVRFEVRAGPLENEILRDVPASALKPYERHGLGTRALCDHGTTLLSSHRLVPCTILAPSIMTPGAYRVLMESRNGDKSERSLSYGKLPTSRVRRFIAGAEPLEGVEGFGPSIAFPDPLGDDATGDSGELRGMVEVGGEVLWQPMLVLDYDAAKGGPNERPAYLMLSLLQGVEYPGVGQEFVRPYRVYDADTKVVCNVGDSKKEPDMVDCRVNSHFVDKYRGTLWYSISYENKEDLRRSVYATLPYDMVGRT